MANPIPLGKSPTEIARKLSQSPKSVSMFPGIVSAVGSLAGSVFNYFSTRSTNKAAAREAELNRIYNSIEAEKSRAYNSKMWNLNNYYNHPANQMARLSAAGLNPNMAYGEIGSGTASMQSDSGPASSSSLPSFTPPQLSFDAAATQKLLAEAKNLDQNTKKQAEETDIFASDAKYRDSLNQSTLDTQSSTIYLNKASANLTKQEATLIKPRLANLNAQSALFTQSSAESMARVQSINQDTLSKKLDNLFKSETFEARVTEVYEKLKNLRANTALTLQQFRSLCVLTPLQALNLMQDFDVKEHQKGLIDAQTYAAYQNGDLSKGMLVYYDAATNKMNYDFELDKKYRSLERAVGVASDIVHLMNDIKKSVLGETTFKFGPFSKSF